MSGLFVAEDLHDASSVDGRRVCGWCRASIPARTRRDAKYCGVRCRQAAHRFQAGRVVRAAASTPLRFGYADPPYPGKSHRYYSGHRDFAGEVDHAELVDRLVEEFPDGWALSTSAAALRDVLALCPSTVSVAAWVRGERPTKAWSPLSAWEPVIYCGGRAQLRPVEDRRTDALVYAARPRTTEPNRVVGAKPGAFCWWLFDLLGALPGDDLVDLFPGSGGVAKAWRMYVSVVATTDTSSRSGDPHDGSLAAPASTDPSRPGHRDLSPLPANPTRRPSTPDVSASAGAVGSHHGETRREAQP